MHRRSLAIAAGLALLSVLGCKAARTRRGAPASSPVPGVVLVCFDTLRADVVSSLAADGRLPAWSAFAREATDFTDATSPSSWTAPGVASILSGRVPSAHGVLGPLRAPPLLEGVPTLAEAFRRAGWWTAASTGGLWVSRPQGLDRGFDAWSESFDAFGPAREIPAWNAMRPRDRPFFLFLHTYAPHDPYGPKGAAMPHDPAATARAEETVSGLLARAVGEGRNATLPADVLGRLATGGWTDAREAEAIERRMSGDRHPAIAAQILEWHAGGWSAGPDPAATVARFRGGYEAGLAGADRMFDLTLAMLAACLPQGTVVAVVSDHGEAFGDHGRLGHGSDVFDEAIRVPFLLRAPGVLPPGVVRGGCSTVDVAATLLEIAGLSPLDGADGRSLLPLARGEEAGRPVVAETERFDSQSDPPTVLRVVAVRTPEAKYLVEFDVESGVARSEVLFDLVTDPAERNPLPFASPARFGRDFCAAVARVRSALASGAPCPGDLCRVE